MICPRCEGKGKLHRNYCTMCHDSAWDHVCDDGDYDCPKCSGTGQVPDPSPTPSASQEGETRSLGQIVYEEWSAIVHPSGGIPWERVGMQVGWENIAQAAVISATKELREEIERMKEQAKIDCKLIAAMVIKIVEIERQLTAQPTGTK